MEVHVKRKLLNASVPNSKPPSLDGRPPSGIYRSIRYQILNQSFNEHVIIAARMEPVAIAAAVEASIVYYPLSFPAGMKWLWIQI